MTYETPTGANMFAYCMNNPVNTSDYTGEFALSAYLGIKLGGIVVSAMVSGAVAAITGGDVIEAAIVGGISAAVSPFFTPVETVALVGIATFTMSLTENYSVEAIDKRKSSEQINHGKLALKSITAASIDMVSASLSGKLNASAFPDSESILGSAVIDYFFGLSASVLNKFADCFMR